MGSRGLTGSQMSECLGIPESTLYPNQCDYKVFNDTIKTGRSEGVIKVSNALFAPFLQSDEWL